MSGCRRRSRRGADGWRERRGGRSGGRGVGGLQAVAGDADDGGLVGRDAAVGVEARGDGCGDAACGLGKDAFGLGEFLDAGDDLDIGDVLGPASVCEDHLCGGGAVGGIADGERAGDGVGPLRNDVLSSLFDRDRDGRAAGGLRAEEAHGARRLLDQAEKDELVEGLADLADQRAAGHGNDDVVRQAPAELLGDLVADGLRAFRVVGAQVDVDEAPVVLVRDQRGEAVDVVVVAVDADEARAIDERVENLRGLEIGGHQDAGLQSEARGLRGDGVREVAGGGAADRVEAELARVGQRNGDDAILEAERGKADGVVLDVEAGGADARAEAAGVDQRREADGQIRLKALRHGQQPRVAPDAGGAAGDGIAGEDALGVESRS